MRAWPSYVGIILGSLGIAVGLLMYYATDYTSAASIRSSGLAGTFLLGGAILLAAGLHSLQATFQAWCDGCDWEGGCGCCGDGCACGDCDSCGGTRGHEGHEAQGHSGHGHDAPHQHD